VCTQDITQEFKAKVTEEKLSKQSEISKNLSSLERILTETDEEIEKLNVVLKQIRTLENEVHINSRQITDLQTYITEQQRTLKKSGGSSEDLKAEINTTAEQITNFKSKRLDILEDKQYNEIISAVIKDNGIKSRIITQYVPKMNLEINKYLDLMDLGLTFEINENFEERILSRFKDELSYSSFSAGERARIDIAILFTWRELAKLKNSLSCNLLFLDEIFDAVLDDQGLESFINLLKYHLSETNVFLISHRPEVVDKFESNLRIIKTSNFSRIDIA
jgi:DNA repair exonuclease SbcCD ATPase subunit